MLEPVLNKIDKSLESEHFKNLDLSIQLKLNGFSFSILNSDINKIVAVVEYEFDDSKNPLQLLNNIKEVFENNSLLSMKFNLVNVIHVNQISTLVPTPLFDDEKLFSYISLNHKILDNEFLAFDILENTETANIYSPFVEVNDFLFEKYGEFVYKHFSSVLIDLFLEKQNSSNELKMFVHVQSEQFEIIVVKDKKLQLYNSFNYDTAEDFVYFVLFTAEQLKINPEEFVLELYGNIDFNSDLYKLLYKYVRNIQFGTRTSNKQYSHELDNIEEHKFISLFNQ